jgi:hypothetical protein
MAQGSAQVRAATAKVEKKKKKKKQPPHIQKFQTFG